MRSRWTTVRFWFMAAVWLLLALMPQPVAAQWWDAPPLPIRGSDPNFGDGPNEIVTRGSNGHVYLSSYEANAWTTSDVTALTGAPVSAGEPFFFDRENSYVSVVYRGTDGHVYELYRRWLSTAWSPWLAGDLTQATGATLAAGDPVGIWRDSSDPSGDFISVFYRGVDGQVNEIYLPITYHPNGIPSPWTYGAWTFGVPGQLAAAPTASGPPALLTIGQTFSAFYRSSGGHIVELYTSGPQWVAADLGALLGAPDAAGHPFVVYDWSTGAKLVAYRSTSNHVILLACTLATGVWSVSDLTVSARAPATLSDPSVYNRRDGYTAVVYRAGNGNVYELFRRQGGGNWRFGDLTALTGAPVASGSPLGGAPWYAPEGNRVVYRGADGRLYAIFMAATSAGASSPWMLETISSTPSVP